MREPRSLLLACALLVVPAVASAQCVTCPDFGMMPFEFYAEVQISEGPFGPDGHYVYPFSVPIADGGFVRFANDAATEPHHFVAEDFSFDTALIAPGGGLCCIFFTSATPRRIPFSCLLHPLTTEVGEIIVLPPDVVDAPGIVRNPAEGSLVLGRNRPNPVVTSTRIGYTVPAPGGAVEIAVYDVRGALVRRLVGGWMSAGDHEVSWDGSNSEGRPVASGVYLYRLRHQDRELVGHATVVR